MFYKYLVYIFTMIKINKDAVYTQSELNDEWNNWLKNKQTEYIYFKSKRKIL